MSKPLDLPQFGFNYLIGYFKVVPPETFSVLAAASKLVPNVAPVPNVAAPIRCLLLRGSG